MKIFKFLVFICYCFNTFKSFAQSPKVIEADLLKSFNKIEFWEEHQNDSIYNFNGVDSLRIANDIFCSKLENYLVKYPFTFNQKFNSIKHLLIKTSDDMMLKTYSWDDGMGGTERFYKSVIQFKSKHKLVSKFLNNSLFIINVHTVHADKKTYYLLE